MGWFLLAVCGFATYLAFKVSSAIGIFALINAIVNFWSLGIMHNYSQSSVASSNDERFAITLNMITDIIGVVLLFILIAK